MSQVKQLLKKAEHATFGTARLVKGHSTLSKAAAAGVTPGQMRAIFTDLAGVSDSEINGFVNIGNQLVQGEITIENKAFSSPDTTPVSGKCN